MKTTITITIDTEILYELKEKTDNISGTINKLLKEFINLKELKIDKTKEKVEIELIKKKAEVMKIEERLENLKKDEIKKEKEEIEKHGIPFKLPCQ